MIDENLPSINDLDERINVNLEKGMTLEQIEQDTINLIRNCEVTVLRCNTQIYIYKTLIDRINQRSK